MNAVDEFPFLSRHPRFLGAGHFPPPVSPSEALESLYSCNQVPWQRSAGVWNGNL
ncbi:unnamed protein product [Prunus armeniaca]|uniref:Uncharacterized protein n=1 Tax=Prunus armeniaca TaxID=36596 RepID=A0A6J5V3S2_PRUAR|nr:unnamed protein product [Prunus armeniaca]